MRPAWKGPGKILICSEMRPPAASPRNRRGVWGGLGLPLDPDDLLNRLLPPGAGLHRVVVGHDADTAAADLPDAGDDPVGGRVGLLAPGEQPVLLAPAAGGGEGLGGGGGGGLGPPP